VDAACTLLPPSSGRLREGSPAELRESLVKLYDDAYATRPGWSERAARHWDYRLADLDTWRRGSTTLRAVLHESDHGVDGYALWRAGNRWTDTGPAGEVKVLETLATTPAAYASLWRYLLTIDLTRTTSAWSVAPDEPLLSAISEPRRLDARLGDALWVRVLDVPAALAARRYVGEVDVVLEITDAMVAANTGRWRLHVLNQDLLHALEFFLIVCVVEGSAADVYHVAARQVCADRRRDGVFQRGQLHRVGDAIDDNRD